MTKKVYIRFKDPKAELSLTPGRPVKTAVINVIGKILSIFIPKANPDFEHLLDKVDYWEIEYDTEENATWREIGFNNDGNSIVAMPFGKNYGYWTDNDLILNDYEDFEPSQITKKEFEHNWTEFEKEKK